MTETVLPLMLKQSVKDRETRKVTWRIQQDVFEWLVDEFMLLMWS